MVNWVHAYMNMFMIDEASINPKYLVLGKLAATHSLADVPSNHSHVTLSPSVAHHVTSSPSVAHHVTSSPSVAHHNLSRPSLSTGQNSGVSYSKTQPISSPSLPNNTPSTPVNPSSPPRKVKIEFSEGTLRSGELKKALRVVDKRPSWSSDQTHTQTIDEVKRENSRDRLPQYDKTSHIRQFVSDKSNNASDHPDTVSGHNRATDSSDHRIVVPTKNPLLTNKSLASIASLARSQSFSATSFNSADEEDAYVSGMVKGYQRGLKIHESREKINSGLIGDWWKSDVAVKESKELVNSVETIPGVKKSAEQVNDEELVESPAAVTYHRSSPAYNSNLYPSITSRRNNWINRTPSQTDQIYEESVTEPAIFDKNKPVNSSTHCKDAGMDDQVRRRSKECYDEVQKELMKICSENKSMPANQASSEICATKKSDTESSVDANGFPGIVSRLSARERLEAVLRRNDEQLAEKVRTGFAGPSKMHTILKNNPEFRNSLSDVLVRKHLDAVRKKQSGSDDNRKSYTSMDSDEKKELLPYLYDGSFQKRLEGLIKKIVHTESSAMAQPSTLSPDELEKLRERWGERGSCLGDIMEMSNDIRDMVNYWKTHSLASITTKTDGVSAPASNHECIGTCISQCFQPVDTEDECQENSCHVNSGTESMATIEESDVTSVSSLVSEDSLRENGKLQNQTVYRSEILKGLNVGQVSRLATSAGNLVTYEIICLTTPGLVVEPCWLYWKVVSIVSLSSCERDGRVRIGDILFEINGQSLWGVDRVSLRNILNSFHSGKTLHLTLLKRSHKPDNTGKRILTTRSIARFNSKCQFILDDEIRYSAGFKSVLPTRGPK